jgi:hypothetical protein
MTIRLAGDAVERSHELMIVVDLHEAYVLLAGSPSPRPL